MRRLMIQACGSEVEADRALAILIAHLVKAGYGGHDKGRLRDFLVRGIRSAAKAQFEEATQQLETEKKNSSSGASSQAKVPSKPPQSPNLEMVQLESPEWLTFWREGLLQRAWRSLERFQHAQRHQRPTEDELLPADAPAEDLVHDVLRLAMSHPSESAEVLAGRVASKAGHTVTPDEVKRQLGIARVRFAQLIADEVAQTLQAPSPKGIQAEIKALELQKAFAGVKILP